jgi:cytochrome bd-type quinol oxidase subunit 2
VKRFARSVAAGLALLALPRLAHACAVCAVFPDERARKAIFNATVFMSLLPLATIALGLWWFARRAGKALASEFQESPDAVVAPAMTERGRG